MQTTHRRIAPAGLLMAVAGLVFALGAMAADEGGTARGTDNQLTPREKADGWVLLFDGKSAAGWMAGNKPLAAANVQDGAINPHDAGAYVSHYKDPFGDFVLSCDYKVSRGANSGIFFRVADLKDPVQTGIELQVYDQGNRPNPGRNGNGAIYDAQAPSSNPAKPAGQWNHVELTAQGNLIKVSLNGQQIVDMDLDRWTTPRKNPDGSENKFAKALKDFPRTGYIGLQDHGNDVWYRNIKIKPLKK